ncbi:MAG TPA: hypothetical protein VF335_10225 [Chitinivibrionales bacterium]
MQKFLRASYSEILLKLVQSKDRHSDTADIEPLAYMPYDRELAAKNEALHAFWKLYRLHGRPQEIIASPKPRHYRTTTKRRVFFAHGKYRLRFSHHKEATAATAMLCSELEPREHDAIYQFIADKINTPPFSVIAKNLTYVIIRGSYTEFCVLFNVGQINGPIVRNLKILAKHLQGLDINIVSSLAFFDPTRSDYYLDNKQTHGAWKTKTLFGPETLRLSVSGQTYRFDPVSFSQVNESMLPAMLQNAARLAGGGPQARLIDLYCGYGLFANYVGKKFGEAYAVDYDETSVTRGRETARYTASKEKLTTRMYFRTAAIRPSSLEALLPEAGSCEETILLDPPRQGPEKGVIAFCAAREPARVVHIWCGIDRIAEDMEQWQGHGYRVAEVVALDMFPGTVGLELMAFLEPF